MFRLQRVPETTGGSVLSSLLWACLLALGLALAAPAPGAAAAAPPNVPLIISHQP